MSAPDLPADVLEQAVAAYVACHNRAFNKMPYSGPSPDKILAKHGVTVDRDPIRWQRACAWIVDQAIERGAITRTYIKVGQVVCDGCGREFASWVGLRTHQGRSKTCIDPIEHMVLIRLNEGATWAEIADELKCSHGTIAKAAEKFAARVA